MTCDYPSANNDGKMPVLDLKCWTKGNEILYEHYRKPMCADSTLLSSSALPARIKRNTHSQEVVRILRNCHKKVPWTRKAEILSEYMARLKTSGYGPRYRGEILKSGLRGYQKMEEVQRAGGRRVNRHDSVNHVARKIKKMLEPKMWYKIGGHNTVLFVPATPNSELANLIREKEQLNSQGRAWSVKIVETSGRTLKSSLQRSDPTPRTPCGTPECMSCPHGYLGQCQKEGAVYRVHCTNPNCGKEGVRYWGESSRTLSLRQTEHLRGLKKGKVESPLWQHCAQEHQGETQDFAMQIVSTHQEPLSRLIKEGVMISRDDPKMRLNSRSNYRQPKVSRTLRVRGLGEVQQSNLITTAATAATRVTAGTTPPVAPAADNVTSGQQNSRNVISSTTAATTAAAAITAAAVRPHNRRRSTGKRTTTVAAAATTTAAAASRQDHISSSHNSHNSSSSSNYNSSSSSNSVSDSSSSRNTRSRARMDKNINSIQTQSGAIPLTTAPPQSAKMQQKNGKISTTEIRTSQKEQKQQTMAVAAAVGPAPIMGCDRQIITRSRARVNESEIKSRAPWDPSDTNLQ